MSDEVKCDCIIGMEYDGSGTVIHRISGMQFAYEMDEELCTASSLV